MQVEKPRRFGCSSCLGCRMERRVAGSQGHQHQAPHQELLALCLRARRSLQSAKTWRRSGERQLVLKRVPDRADSGSAPCCLVLLPAWGCGRRRELGQGDLGLAAGNGAAATLTCVAAVPNLSWGKDRLEQLSKALGFSLGTQTKPRGAGSWNPEPGLARPQARAESIGISVPALLPLQANCCTKHGKLHF